MRRRASTFLRLSAIALSLIAVITLLITGSFSGVQKARAASPQRSFAAGTGQPHFALSRHGGSTVRTTQPPLTYHGGATARTSTIYLIFWEPPTLQDGTRTYVSPTYNSLIQQYFTDVGGSGLYNVNTQYYDKDTQDYGSPGHIQNSSTLGGVWIDTSAYPTAKCHDSYTLHGCLTDGQLQTEVQNAMTTNSWSGGITHLFFVFTSWGEGSCHGDCAFSNFCAYHWSFTYNGQPVAYANLPYSGTDLLNCGVPTSPNNDFDSDSDINWASHEEMEMITDPVNSGWIDKNGGENGDKCDYIFGPVTLDNNTANQEWNGHYYLVQMEWSNAILHCAQSRALSGTVYVGSGDTNLYAFDANSGTQSWRATTNGSIVSSPTVVNGVSYAGSNDGSVYAFNATSGSQIWSYVTGGPVTSSPVVYKTAVYAGSESGTFFAINAAAGALNWSFATGGPIRSSPAIANGIVYTGSDDGNLYSFNASTGKEIWAYSVGAAIDARPIVSGGVVYTATENGSLYAINAAHGKLKWSATIPSGGGISASPALSNGLVIAGSLDDSIYAFNTSNGSLAWSYQTGGAITSSPVIVNSFLYVGSADGSIYAFTTVSGKLAWSYQTGGTITSSPAIASGTLYTGSADANVYALDSKSGSLIWTYKTGGAISATPVISDGLLYTGSADMNVYALWADDGSWIWQSATGGAIASPPDVVLSSY